MFHCNGIWFLWYGVRGSCINLHFHHVCHAHAHFVFHKLRFWMNPAIHLGSIVLSKRDDEKGCESVWLSLIIHHFPCDDTTYRCLRHSVNCWLCMSNALSLVKGDMFIGGKDTNTYWADFPLILYLLLSAWMLGSNPFLACWLPIKYSTWSCKLWPLNLIGTLVLCPCGIFNVDVTNAMLFRSSLFLVYVRKEPSLSIKRCLSES